MEQEIWRDVNDFPNYIVSNFGNVGNKRTGRLFSRESLTGGYPVVTLHRGYKKSGKTFYIHKLVAAAFLGPRPAGYEINHKDFDKTNNRADNLEYVTPARNSEHARLAGRGGKPPPSVGEANGHALLTRKEVDQIRDLSANGVFTHRELSEIYDIARGHIGHIIRGGAWT